VVGRAGQQLHGRHRRQLLGGGEHAYDVVVGLPANRPRLLVPELPAVLDLDGKSDVGNRVAQSLGHVEQDLDRERVGTQHRVGHRVVDDRAVRADRRHGFRHLVVQLPQPADRTTGHQHERYGEGVQNLECARAERPVVVDQGAVDVGGDKPKGMHHLDINLSR
jgi:hypothetical protein